MDKPPYVVVSTGGTERVSGEYINFTGDFDTLSAIRVAAVQRLSMKREDSKDDSLLTINKSNWYCGVYTKGAFVILVVWGRKLQKADREFLSKLGNDNMWREGLDDISFKHLLYIRDLINVPSGRASEPTILAPLLDSDVRYVLEHAFVARNGQLVCESIDSIASFAELLKMRDIGLQWLKKDPSIEGHTIQMEKNNCFGFHIKHDIAGLVACFVACSKYGDPELYAVPDKKLDEHASDVVEGFLEGLAKEFEATLDRPEKKRKTEGLSVNALLRDSMKSSNKEFFTRLEQLDCEYSVYVSGDEEEKEESGSTSEAEDESLDMEKSSDSEDTGIN